MRIALCDDEQTVLDELKKMLLRYADLHQQEIEILSFSSGSDLLNRCRESGQEIHLLFLDIEMQGMSGLDVKEDLKTVDTVKRIVFLTNHKEAMRMAFGLKVVNFYEKPLEYEALEKLIDVIWQELEENRFITFKTGCDTQRISSEDIVFLCAEKDYSYIYTAQREKTPLIACKLKEWEKKLEGLPFTRIHKSYIVNLAYVSDIRQEVQLSVLEQTLPLGRAYKEQVRQAYEQYIRKIIRKRLL